MFKLALARPWPAASVPSLFPGWSIPVRVTVVWVEEEGKRHPVFCLLVNLDLTVCVMRPTIGNVRYIE